MLTIVIATKDRSDFLLRLFNYYVTVGCKYWISIGDSSSGVHIEQARKIIKDFEGKLKIKYNEYPGYNIAQCHKQLLSSITTPYVACVSDGGFLIPNSLEKCIRFLENNSDYSIAHGLGALFILNQEGALGQFHSIGRYVSLSKVEDETASKRLTRHLDNGFTTAYCVYRADLWKSIWILSCPIKDWSFAGEALPCCLSVISGKVKELDCLYLVRQLHNRRAVNAMPKTYEWFTSPDWYPSYQIFHDSLVKALVEKDGIDEKSAHEIVKRAFWSGLRNRFNRAFNNQYCLSIGKRIKDKFKGIAGLVSCWRMIKSLFFSSRDITLPAFLSKRSPYHNDFMAIYKTVTGMEK